MTSEETEYWRRLAQENAHKSGFWKNVAMVNATRSAQWKRRCRKLQAKIRAKGEGKQVVLSSEETEMLRDLLKDAEKPNGNQKHDEFRAGD